MVAPRRTERPGAKRRALESIRSTGPRTIGENGAVTDFPLSHRDLLEAKVASLATLRADGFPQLTEVWFLHHDGELRLSLNDSRLKTRNLIARPQCSLLLLDIANPDRYLEVRALAHAEPDERVRLRRHARRQVRRCRPAHARPARGEASGDHARAGERLPRRRELGESGGPAAVTAARRRR